MLFPFVMTGSADNHSNEEIRHFVEKVLTKRDDIKVAYYRPGDTVYIANR